MRRLIASESVTEGHPDKICDRISDEILDALLRSDKDSRSACECCCKGNFLLIMGEVTSKAEIDYEKIARDAIKNIGYDREELGFDYKNCRIKLLIDKQSPDIARGVDSSLEHGTTKADFDEIGAGDQGMMFGYATNETDTLMPLPVALAHGLAEKLAEVRKNGGLDFLRPDGKAMVAVEYEDDKPKRVDTVVLSAQHDDTVDIGTLREKIMSRVIKAVIPAEYTDGDTKYYINPTGRFVVGGPEGDSGLTGRKIIVDTYGGVVPHGGGAFSGKDATKVDRSAAYFARYVAVNLVSAGLCDRCEIRLAYVIGKANPVSVDVDTFGTGKLPDDVLTEIVRNNFDFRPKAIIENLGLKAPIFAKTADYGHFGHKEYSWEKPDKAEILKKYV